MWNGHSFYTIKNYKPYFVTKLFKNSYPTLAILLVLSKTAIKTGLLLWIHYFKCVWKFKFPKKNIANLLHCVLPNFTPVPSQGGWWERTRREKVMPTCSSSSSSLLPYNVLRYLMWRRAPETLSVNCLPAGYRQSTDKKHITTSQKTAHKQQTVSNLACSELTCPRPFVTHPRWPPTKVREKVTSPPPLHLTSPHWEVHPVAPGAPSEP